MFDEGAASRDDMSHARVRRSGSPFTHPTHHTSVRARWSRSSCRRCEMLALANPIAPNEAVCHALIEVRASSRFPGLSLSLLMMKPQVVTSPSSSHRASHEEE